MKKEILKRLKDRLNDLSRRNRAIRLSRIVKRKNFDISELYKLDDGLPVRVIDNIVYQGRSINIINTNIRTKDEENILKSLNYLRRDVEFILKEKGIYACYLGYPFIQGNFYEGSFFRCPLFLYPLVIEHNFGTQKIVFRPLNDEPPLINKTFFLAFNKFNKGHKNVNIQELETFEEIDRKELLNWALELFKKLELEIIQKSFTLTKLNNLTPLKTDEMPTDMQGKIEILPLGIVGEFSQLNSSLNSDYDYIIKNDYLNELANALLGDKEQKDLEKRYDEDNVGDYPEQDNFFITQPDLSQEKVLVGSRKGKGLVIHGPPGTGKSQVITNLIADNLVRDKKILVVCEKRAALDVVDNRLASKQLNKFCLLVHDAQNDRNKLLQKIASILDGYDVRDGHYSSEQAKEKVSNLSKQFDEKIQGLKTIVGLMHSKNEFDTNLYFLYRTSNKNQKTVLNLNQPVFKNIKYNSLLKISEKISKIADKTYNFDNPEHPLYFRKPFDSSFNEIDFKESIQNLVNLLKKIESVFYKEEYKKDLKKLTSKQKLTYDLLFTIYPELEYYHENESKIHRFVNIKWIKYYFKYKTLFEHDSSDMLLKRWREADSLLKELHKNLAFLDKTFTKAFVEQVLNNILNFKNNSKTFEKMLSSLKDIDDLLVLDIVKSKLDDSEKELLKLCKENIAFKKQGRMEKIWDEIIKNSFYLKWIDQIESEHPELKQFSYNKYDQLQKELAKTLDEKLNSIPFFINGIFQDKYSKLKWEEYDGDGRRQNYNNLKYLIHEVNKKRKRVSIRQLVEQFKNEGLFELFPCWMCSPETVSNIFPLKKDLFDIVIFDEASQCKLERAIPSVTRGKKLIVAGDENQLPPSTFFMTNWDNEEEDENFYEELDYEEKQLLEDDSLLVRSRTVFPDSRLIYHYRSNFEELINFSNYAFYNGDLRVIPRNWLKNKKPIEFIKLNGRWENKCNIEEAKQTVVLLKKLLKSNSQGLTFGIITFNIKQKEMIEDLLEEEARKDAMFAKLLEKEYNRYNQDEYTGIFVKNIENVQGDERDIIIFSISYGYDHEGKFRYRFGPLNGVYGRNRLNVAISRARARIYVLCSFDPQDLKYEGKYDGPKLLARYLTYCKAVSEGEEKQSYTILNSLNEKEDAIINEFEEYDSDFEGEVRDELTKLGYEVKTQVGCKGYKIDLGIVHPKDKTKFLAGIECDGAAYHSSKSAKERDIYRQSVLEGSGWKILRIWSRDWWKNSQTEVKRLDRELKAVA